MTTSPTNDHVANLLTRFGQLLELSGESGFRVRAYDKAADTIRHHPEPVDILAHERRLTSLPGIGPGIAAAVEEIIRTGAWSSLNDLEAQLPPTLIDLLAIPGVGAKTVGRLFLEHQIVDVAGLEAAIISGKLRGVPGLGVKTEAKILAGIESLRRRTGRILLGTALPIARRFVAALEQALPDGRISLAGSVRRMQETVGDIDLVVAASNVDAARQALREFPEVSSITDETATSVRFRLISGIEADVYFSALDSFGSTLLRATGNGSHIERLGSIREAASEEEVYAAVDLPWISPELRQGVDEFELARLGRLERLIQLADVVGEFHSHTVWSDGTASVEEMAQAARRRGYQFLGISDHTRSLGVANGLDEVRIREQRHDILRANVATGIRVFAGAEVEVSRDGVLDLGPEILADLDVVIASLHSGLRQPRDTLTERLVRVLRNGNVDIVAHPSGRLLERREPGDFDWSRAFEVAAETGTALEINADPSRLDLSAILARQALESGCLLTINCDAHHPDGFQNLEYGIAVARQAGATGDQVLNCWPVERIEDWLRKRAGGEPPS